MAGAGSDATCVAVTGADGFIGRALVAHLRANGFDVRAITRATFGDLAVADEHALATSLAGVDTLFHLAARAHVMRETAADPQAAFDAANVVATERVARAGRAAGVRRFVQASTAKVNGESTVRGRPFRSGDAPSPQDAYARSKWQAERVLQDIASGSPTSAVVLRLPLVYGRGVRGNFRTLWDAVARRQWLPLAALDNRRSLLGLGNLVDACVAAMNVPAGTYFVADADSVSTPQLVRGIAEALHVDANLAYVPVALLRLAGIALGRRDAVARLTGSLEIDASSFQHASGWSARADLASGLRSIADATG